jgi:hypothetical protein
MFIFKGLRNLYLFVYMSVIYLISVYTVYLTLTQHVVFVVAVVVVAAAAALKNAG